MGLRDYLEQRLQETGGNKSELARRIGVDVQYVINWLNGQTPRPPMCQKIAEAFGLTEDEVLIMAGHKSGQTVTTDDPGLEAILAEVRNILKPRKERQRRGILEMVRVFDRYNANFPVRAL